jgi:hypothetical protein
MLDDIIAWAGKGFGFMIGICLFVLCVVVFRWSYLLVEGLF